MPLGQGPHLIPWGVSMHFTPGWQGLGTQEGRGCIPPIPEERGGQLSSVFSSLKHLLTQFVLLIYLSHLICPDVFRSIFASYDDMNLPTDINIIPLFQKIIVYRSSLSNTKKMVILSTKLSQQKPKPQIQLKSTSVVKILTIKITMCFAQLIDSPQASHSITVFFRNTISFIWKTQSVQSLLGFTPKVDSSIIC